MRDRDRILASLETVYREAFDAARERDDPEAMTRLDFEFQRDQIQLEVLLDLRDLLVSPEADDEATRESLLDKAQKLRNLTRLR